MLFYTNWEITAFRGPNAGLSGSVIASCGRELVVRSKDMRIFYVRDGEYVTKGHPINVDRIPIDHDFYEKLSRGEKV